MIYPVALSFGSDGSDTQFVIYSDPIPFPFVVNSIHVIGKLAGNSIRFWCGTTQKVPSTYADVVNERNFLQFSAQNYQGARAISGINTPYGNTDFAIDALEYGTNSRLYAAGVASTSLGGGNIVVIFSIEPLETSPGDQDTAHGRNVANPIGTLP